MVSEKMYELGTKKSTIRTIFEFGRKRAAEVGEENIYDFSLGNPNVPTPEFVKQAAIDILQTMPPEAVHGYTIAPGNPQVREALAKSINDRFGTHFAGKNLFMTAGAAAAITICFKALCEEGDEFITFAPFFPEYRCFVESVGGKLVVVPARVEDFQIDFAAFESLLTPHTKAVIVNSPNNPSGVVYSEATIKELAAILKRKEQEYGHPIYIISDEPYREIAYEGNTVPYIPLYYRERSSAIPTASPSRCRASVSATSSCRTRLPISAPSMVPSPVPPACSRMSTRRHSGSLSSRAAPACRPTSRRTARTVSCSTTVSSRQASPASSRRVPSTCSRSARRRRLCVL